MRYASVTGCSCCRRGRHASLARCPFVHPAQHAPSRRSPQSRPIWHALRLQKAEARSTFIAQSGHACSMNISGEVLTMSRALIAICVVSIAWPCQLLAQGKGIRLWNLTTATITGFQLSPAGQNTWGPNQTLNDKDKEVDHDERLRITGVAPGRYDAKVSYAGAKQCI